MIPASVLVSVLAKDLDDRLMMASSCYLCMGRWGIDGIIICIV